MQIITNSMEILPYGLATDSSISELVNLHNLLLTVRRSHVLGLYYRDIHSDYFRVAYYEALLE